MDEIINYWPVKVNRLGGFTYVSSAERRVQVQLHAKRKQVEHAGADVSDAELAHHLLWGVKPPRSEIIG